MDSCNKMCMCHLRTTKVIKNIYMHCRFALLHKYLTWIGSAKKAASLPLGMLWRMVSLNWSTYMSAAWHWPKEKEQSNFSLYSLSLSLSLSLWYPPHLPAQILMPWSLYIPLHSIYNVYPAHTSSLHTPSLTLPSSHPDLSPCGQLHVLSVCASESLQLEPPHGPR